MNRRSFLQIVSGAGLSLLASQIPGLRLTAQAQTMTGIGQAQRFFVLIRITEGWDVTLSLDPQVHTADSDQSDMFIEYRSDEIWQQNGIRLAPAAAPIAPYASDIAIVNGVFVSDTNFGHPENLSYMTTGDGGGAAAGLPIELAASTGAGPFGVVFEGDLSVGDRRIVPSTFSNMIALKKTTDFSVMKSFFNRFKGRSELQAAYNSLAENQMILAGLRTELERLSGDFDENAVNSGDAVAKTRRAAAVTAASFASGCAYQSQFDLRLDLDSHDNHEGRHLRTQTTAWEGLAEMFRIFKEVPYGLPGDSLFDHTTFMVVSEFARTPYLNASKGKDHNPMTNSVLLAGGSVQGGQVLGASRLVTRRKAANGVSRHVAMPIDYATGALPVTKEQARTEQFKYIQPENIVATVAKLMGADPKRFQSVPQGTPVLSTLIKV